MNGEIRIRKGGIKEFGPKNRQVTSWVRAMETADGEFQITEGPFATLQLLIEKAAPILNSPGKTGYDVALRMPLGAALKPVIDRYWHPQLDKWVMQRGETGGGFGAFIINVGTTQSGDLMRLTLGDNLIQFAFTWDPVGSTNFTPEEGGSLGLWTIVTNTINENGSEALASFFGTLVGLPALFKNVESDFSTFIQWELVDFWASEYIWELEVGTVWNSDMLVTKFPQTEIVRQVQP